MNPDRITAQIDGLLRDLDTAVAELERKIKRGKGSSDVEAIISEINTKLVDHYVKMTPEQQRKYEQSQRVYNEMMKEVYPKIR
jgi:Skp family chaperone for outer membrane proteins